LTLQPVQVAAFQEDCGPRYAYAYFGQTILIISAPEGQNEEKTDKIFAELHDCKGKRPATKKVCLLEEELSDLHQFDCVYSNTTVAYFATNSTWDTTHKTHLIDKLLLLVVKFDSEHFDFELIPI